MSIFFGHQSVGANLLDGIQEFGKAYYGKTITVSESREPGAAGDGVLLHSSIGENTKPFEKIEDFAAIMRSGMAENVDAAFMKFCYLDVQADTDVSAIFSEYRRVMSDLAEEYPDVTIAWMTVPLVTEQRGFKPFVKRLLGRPVWGLHDNRNRQRLNELIREEAAREGIPLFDLAAWESTYPDGSRNMLSLDGERFFALIPEYSSDSGHLNEYGRRFVGEKFLQFLAALEGGVRP